MLTPKQIITAALRSDRTSLNEVEAKIILRYYGIPVVSEEVVSTKDQTIEAFEEYGCPVVLKGLCENLSHKTEHGLVFLNCANSESVSLAAEKILSGESGPGAQIVIQPHIRGRREFVVGFFRDPQFGAAVMFGLGGIFTEAMSDIILRLAPITSREATEMIGSIRAHSLLGEYRGEKSVDRKTMVQTLMAISTIAEDFPEVNEIDINPIIADSSGKLHVVDALFSLAKPEKDKKKPYKVSPPTIRSIFYPRSIVFVGASSQLGKWGHTMPCNTIGGGYRGEIYLVNPKGGKIAGNLSYKSLSEVPHNIDLAVVTLPVAYIKELIPQLKAKGIFNVVLVTSGFGESGQEGKELEQQLIEEARSEGLYIIGPNTMGISNPHINLFCTGLQIRPLAGSTAMIAQSGNMGGQLLAFAEEQGIGIRAFAGSGNEAMITIEDFMEAFEVDDLTKIILLYIESVKHGRRFFESARRMTPYKPIVLLKGGQTKAGKRAATTHTGALASDTRLFDAACQQAGIIKVDLPMDLLDLSAALSSLPLPRGNRVAIMTIGGGWGVVTADLCYKLGLEIPDLSVDLITEIDRILPPFWSRGNPIDLVGDLDPSVPLTIMEALLKWEGCDAVINLGIFGRRILVKRLTEAIKDSDASYSQDVLEEAVKQYTKSEFDYAEKIVRMMDRYGKPVVGVSFISSSKEETVFRVKGSEHKAVFYKTPEQAVNTLARLVQYSDFKQKAKRSDK